MTTGWSCDSLHEGWAACATLYTLASNSNFGMFHSMSGSLSLSESTKCDVFDPDSDSDTDPEGESAVIFRIADAERMHPLVDPSA